MLSVTRPRNLTRRGKEQPGKVYAALKPWIEFANVASPLVRGIRVRRFERKVSMRESIEARRGEALPAVREFIEQARDTETFPADLLRQLLKPAPKFLEPDVALKALEDLADNVIGVLDYYALWPPPAGTPPYVIASESVTRVGIDAGRAVLEPLDDPFKYFVRAIAGAEEERIKRCPICDRLFFAARISRPACSRACGTALRVRKHRSNEARAIAMAGAGKTIPEIVRALGLKVVQVRRYVRKAHKRATN
jgi:hypothetical protein